MSTWSIEDPTLGPFTLDEANNLVVSDYNLGYATVRAVPDIAPNADGEGDLTSLSGPRLVTLTTQLFGSPATRQLTAGKLRQYLDARRRINLVWNSAGFGLVRFAGRGDMWDGPLAPGQSTTPNMLAFHVPSGIFESYDLVTPTPSLVVASGSAALGRTYDLTFDRVYPAAPVAGLLNVVNLGTARVYPLLRIWGPVVNPALSIGTSGGAWSLSANGGVTLAAGEYVDIDTRNPNIVKNTGDILFRYLDKPTVSWGWLEPGTNDLHFTGTGTASTTHVDVLFRYGYR